MNARTHRRRTPARRPPAHARRVRLRADDDRCVVGEVREEVGGAAKHVLEGAVGVGEEGADLLALDGAERRPGQVIVCENQGADWLPFTPLADVKTTRAASRSVEVVWIREDEPTAASGQPDQYAA